MHTKAKEFAEKAILRVLAKDHLRGELKIQISIKMVPVIVEALIAELRKRHPLGSGMDNKMIISIINADLVAMCPKCARRTFGSDLFRMYMVQSTGDEQLVYGDPNRPGPMTVFLKGKCAYRLCGCEEMVVYWGQKACSERRIKPCYFCTEELAAISLRPHWNKRKTCPWCGRRQPDADKEYKPPERPLHK